MTQPTPVQPPDQQPTPVPSPSQPSGVSLTPILTIPVPILKELLVFLQTIMIQLNFPPELAAVISIDVVVLVLGFFFIAILEPNDKLVGLIILVILIVITHVAAYFVVRREVKKKAGK